MKYQDFTGDENLVSSEDNKQNIRCPLVDTSFIFSCSTRYLTPEISSWTLADKIPIHARAWMIDVQIDGPLTGRGGGGGCDMYEQQFTAFPLWWEETGFSFSIPKLLKRNQFMQQPWAVEEITLWNISDYQEITIYVLF